MLKEVASCLHGGADAARQGGLDLRSRYSGGHDGGHQDGALRVAFGRLVCHVGPVARRVGDLRLVAEEAALLARVGVERVHGYGAVLVVGQPAPGYAVVRLHAPRGETGERYGARVQFGWACEYVVAESEAADWRTVHPIACWRSMFAFTIQESVHPGKHSYRMSPTITVPR
jgi:hypothetical protein